MIVIEKVLSGSQAERLKIQSGDIIAKYDDKTVPRVVELIRIFRGEHPGDSPKPLVISRAGRTISLTKQPGLLGAMITDRAETSRAESK